MTGDGTTFSFSTNSRMGWECPKCHSCHSPDVETCKRCSPPEYFQPYPYFPSPYEYPTTVPYPYPWWGVTPPPPYHYYYTTSDGTDLELSAVPIATTCASSGSS